MWCPVKPPYQIMGMEKLIQYLTALVPSLEIEEIVGGGYNAYGGDKQASGNDLYSALRGLARELEGANNGDTV